MQLTRALVPAVLGIGVVAASAAPCRAASPFDEATAGTLLRWFTDSDKVAVLSHTGSWSFDLPRRAGLDLQWNHERVVIPAVEAPVGSAEAVDAITTASRPIAGNAYRDFVKRRNELQSALRRGGAALDYYLSSESDYLGQQVGLRVHRDLADQHLNLAAGTSWGWDAIEPLADDDTNAAPDRKTTLHWNVVATRVVTATTLVRVGAEFNSVRGLQHNPYRNVYAGGGPVPERHPDRRERRDAFVKVNQHLPNRSSVRLGWRWYADDWGIDSHEVSSALSQYVTRGLFARYQYRWYTQSAADFWRADYAGAEGVGGYRTGDYRMAPLDSHLFGAALSADFGELASDTPVLGRLTLWLSYERYFNSNNYSANILETGLDVRF